MSIEQIAVLADVALSAALALVTACIAYWQYKINAQRLDSERRDRERLRQRDMYDRRWRIYEGVRDFVDNLLGEVNPVKGLPDHLEALDRLGREARFLFGPDIERYVEELAAHGRALFRALDADPDDPDETDADQRHIDELSWFEDQRDQAPHRFEKYLRLPDE